MKGSIRQRNKGSWELHYDIPSDGTGRRRQRTETVKGTRRDAERVLRERLTATENGGYIPKDKETVGQFLQRWMETYAATNTTLRTQQGYWGNINRYIVPAFGSIKLQDLTARHIQGMYAGMLKRGLSARTVLHSHRVLKEALSHAVKWEPLTRNVADAATPPRPQHKEMEMWDAEIINQFLETAGGSRFRDLYHLAILTGMRRWDAHRPR